MLIRHLKGRKARRGVALAETACVFLLFIPLLMGTVVVGLGVFRYHQVNHLAGEAARWASVRGETYQQEQNQPAPTNAAVLDFVKDRMVGLDADALSAELTMTSGRATVTLRYQWTPEALIRPIEFVSTASAPITY